MKLSVLCGVVFLLVGVLPFASASVQSPVWTLDVGPGYITTAPVVDDDHVYVRTSGFWTGEERPEVLAVNHLGVVQWRHRSNTSLQHDMAPLVRVESGNGACGEWPNLLLVGWADGRFEALNPTDGMPVWSVNTTVEGWGITGAPQLDGDHVVVPLRNGLGRYCLANGVADFEVVTGLGWRNGVSVTNEGYWIGDEDGRLWHVLRNGSFDQPVQLSGALRHAPVVLGEHLLLHVQLTGSSVLLAYAPSEATLTELARLGPSPAIPLSWSSGALFGDSDQLTSVVCSDVCEVVMQVTAHVNGEMAWTGQNSVHAPQNNPVGGWYGVEVDSAGQLELLPTISTPYDGYGTAAPAMKGDIMYLGNDAGVLMALNLNEEATASDGVPVQVLGTLLVALAMGVGARLASTGRVINAWRWCSMVVLCMLLFMAPELNRSWNSMLASTQTTEDVWDPAWPEGWRGTQVVVIEFEYETLVVGGLVGYDDVLALTLAGAQELDVGVTLDSTPLGTYLVSLNGTEATGWEYFVDGQRGTLAVDDASVASNSVLVWRLASAR
jgi:hypothetical protein